MDVYESAQPVTVTLSFEADGVMAASYKVTDETQQTVVNSTALTLSQDATSVDIVVPQSVNTLASGYTRGARVVELAITTPTKTMKVRQRYLIQSLEPWKLPSESFMFFDEAFLVALDFTNLAGWDAASDTARRAALTQAHVSLDTYRYKLCYDPQTMVDFAEEYGIERQIGKLSCLSQAEFDALPGNFKTAVKRAQLLEANDLLGGASEIAKLRQEGVTKKETGEASISFVSEKLQRGRLCARAGQMIAPYVGTSLVIQRG